MAVFNGLETLFFHLSTRYKLPRNCIFEIVAIKGFYVLNIIGVSCSRDLSLGRFHRIPHEKGLGILRLLFELAQPTFLQNIRMRPVLALKDELHLK